jgi:hypothetical protein
MYIHYFTRYVCDYALHFMSLSMNILELLAYGWCWCELVNPLPMLTLDYVTLFCWLFIDAPTFFPQLLLDLTA